ncbi:hypothetical protein CYMTET_53576 [Cymbomonas tetramitiformis]|uniref:Endonuclease/exonuclease/phosphatase domain-containing protein n=1 Tax=Cymbomonas tetramitiformis TaxID=36881 RepID=A0AAE0EQ77_9CHLO|nr:hypothetical protein CYMTET_53576 [Cymbomonas tetramitiformis]
MNRPGVPPRSGPRGKKTVVRKLVPVILCGIFFKYLTTATTSDTQEEEEKTGAKLQLPLSEQFEEQRNLTVKLEQARDLTTTKSKALENFYSEELKDVRLSYTKWAKGYPLETPHGTLDEAGHIRYSLLKNCTTIDGKNLDENGFLANDFHITVGPMRVPPQQAIEFLGHMEAVLRGLHREHQDRHIISRQSPPRPRFHSGRVAALDIKFTKTEYATTVLATTLPLLPVNCFPIGGDLFTQDEPVFPRVRIYDVATRGGSESRMLHVLSDELKGKSITDLEENLLEVEGLESAQKGHRLQQRVASITANWLKLVAVSEEAAQKIETGTVRIPGINDYEVQRVALIKDVDKLAETEVVVVDTGSVIDPEFDTEALVRAVDEVFNTALGEYEHLLPHLAVPSYPATDKKDVASFARLRQLYKGRLFYFIASEEAYRWLTAQEGSQAKVTVEHKGMYFYLRPSDYSRNGKRGRGRQQRPVGITRDDTVVQALEAKLGTFAEAVKAATASRGGELGGDTESAIQDLGRQVNVLSDKVEKGFKDTVDNVKKVNASVDNVDKGVNKIIDLTGNVLKRQDAHLELAENQNKVATAMLQNLIKLNSSAGTPTPTPPSTGTGRRKRGTAGTPASDTRVDTDTDMDTVSSQIENLKRLRKHEKERAENQHEPSPSSLLVFSSSTAIDWSHMSENSVGNSQWVQRTKYDRPQLVRSRQAVRQATEDKNQDRWMRRHGEMRRMTGEMRRMAKMEGAQLMTMHVTLDALSMLVEQTRKAQQAMKTPQQKATQRHPNELVNTMGEGTAVTHEETLGTRLSQQEAVKEKGKGKDATAPQQPSHIGGGTHPAKGTEGQYPKNSVTQGIFAEDGKLNMYQVDLALEKLEENPPGSITIQEILRLLKGNDGRFLEMIKGIVTNRGGTQVPVIGNGHWLLLMIGVCGTGNNRTLQAYVYDSMGVEKHTRKKTASRQMGMAEELQTTISGWAKDNKEAMGCQEARATLMYDKHQYDAYNCGVWVIYIAELWQQWLRERNGTWVQHVYTNTLQTSRSVVLHTTEIANRCRDKFRPMVKAAIMRENTLHMEQDTGEVELIEGVRVTKTEEQTEQVRGTCAADAFMRGMARDYTREQVENMMRQQGVGIQTIMEVEEALHALQQDTDALISETMEKMKTDGRTQIAIKDTGKWVMVMLTMTHRDMQAHVWIPAGGIEKQEELLIAIDVWALLREAYDLQQVHYSGLTTHSTPPEWEKFSQGEQAVRVAGSWKYWHVDGKPGQFKLGTRNTAQAQGGLRETRPVTGQTTGPTEEDTKRDEGRVDGSRKPTMERQATGEAKEEKSTNLTDRLVQTTLQFCPESAEQANERLKEEERTVVRKKLRPPTSTKRNQPTDTPTKTNERDNEEAEGSPGDIRAPSQPDKANSEEAKGSPEARKFWGGGMPKTEDLDGEKMTDGQQHTITFLTWNIQGSRYSLYELEEQMDRWDIDVAVITETKTANDDIKRHFRDSLRSNICTSVPGRGDAEEEHQTAGLAVVLRGEHAKPHNYTEVKVPHLQGVLTHTMLHFPGQKYIHLIGVYYPVEGKETAREEGYQEERTRSEARKGIREYVQMVTSASEGNEDETVLVCGDLNATTGEPRNSRDREWNKVLDATGLTDVGGSRETTLTWHSRRNIDRMLASRAEQKYYTQPTEMELTELHTSDHKMICTTQLDLKAWGTHRPAAQLQRRAKADRLRLPLTEKEGATLRQVLDTAYTREQQDELREAIGMIKRSTTKRHKRKAIDYAGEVVARILGTAKEEAVQNANLPKPAAPPEETHRLHLPKTLRKERDGHLRERNRCRLNISLWKRDIEARESVPEEIRKADFDNRTEEMREWEQWEREQKKIAAKEARKCITEHEANRKQKTRIKMREMYWNNIKHYHKKIYRQEVENGSAPAAIIQAIETRHGKLVVGQQKVAQAMGEHMAWSAPYKMREPERGLAEAPPWLDKKYKNYMQKDKCERPDQTKINLRVDEEAYRQAVRKMKTNKAAGPMGIQNEILKQMPYRFHEQLCELMQLMWGNRHTPLPWKKGYFCFHHKQGDVTQQKNYRPIALLDCLFKLYTAVLTKMLADFCEINGMLSQAQEGSREKHNTMRQLTRITNAIEDANLSKQELHATYIDFENAYGSVDHEKLIATLRHLGVPTQLTEAIKDILGEEEGDSIQMRAKVGEQISEEVPIRRGILQGDSMGPLLFILYLEPLLRWLEVGNHGYRHKYVTDEELRGELRTSSGAFVDDLIILTRLMSGMEQQLKKLAAFGDWSGLRINKDKSKITGVEHGNRNIRESKHKGIKCGNQTLKVLKAGETYKYLGVLLNMLGTWKEEKTKSLRELKRRIAALLATPLTQKQKEYSLKSAVLGKFRYGLHLGIYTQGEIQQVENQLGAALKRIYGLPANGTPNELNTEEKAEYGLGLQSLQAIYAQEVYSGLAEAVQSEEDKGVQMGYGKREKNLRTRQRMSQVSRSTAGLMEKHFGERGYCSNRGKLRMGLQTHTNTMRKMNALNEYGVHVKGVGAHMQELAKETLPIMKQLENARRVYTDAEMEGTIRTTKYLRRMDKEYRDPQEQPMTTGTEKLGTVNVIKDTKNEMATKEINFTKLLTLFRNYPDLKDLTTADGKKALPITALKATGGRVHDNKTVQKIAQGMLHLYPYICEAQPNSIKAPGDHWDHERNRKLKPEYVQPRKTGELEKYTRSTKAMSEIRNWPTQIKALHEAGNSLRRDIMRLMSMYPLANQKKHFEEAGVEWTEQEKEALGIGGVDHEWEEDDIMGEWTPQASAGEGLIQLDERKWAKQEDPMEAPDREGTHAPTRILASRQYLDNPADPDSKVIQYETQWTDSEGNVLSTWSTEESIRKHIPEHNPTGNRRWEELVEEWEGTKQDERTKSGPVSEILAGKPRSEQRYWKEVTHLTITTGETNPDQDIKQTLNTKNRQLRTEGDTTYCYEPNGGLIGTLSTAKVRELYNRYTREVGDGAVQCPTGEQLAKRLRLKLEHKIHVDTFEEEIAQLLIRYSSKAEMKHRKRNLQNHWTLPPEMMEAVQAATGARTEVFASPLNVHKNTTTYYSQYPRDSVFGAAGSAWEAQWGQLGAYQFNPEYTAEDLHRALKMAINATKTAKPVLGVGIYPTYAKSPYRKLLNKHMGYRVHELLEVKEGQFTFLPPDHWMQDNLQKPKQCNWNMRILVVANAAGWRKFCPNAVRTHDIFSKALLRCPQSKVRTVGRACYIHRPLTLRDTDRQPRSITEWEKDCVIDPSPWTSHELPVLRALPEEQVENHVEEIIDRWMEDRGREGEPRGGDRGPRPSTMDVLGANTTWSREEISRDALRRWALQFANPKAEEGDMEGDQWSQRERGETEEVEPQPESQWDSNGKGYPEPDRRFNRNEMVYTDGSQRKVKRENGEQEEATAAGVWDPRGGQNAEYMQRWQGHCQTVNRAELTAIYMALMLEANTGTTEVNICTDSLTSLYQIQNMKRRPHALEKHVHRDILWKIMKQIQTLNGEGTKVALYKVKAHVGIHGNEKADEVARKACVEGEYGFNHDNTDTVKLLAICEATGRQLEGHQAVLNHVTKRVREAKMTGKTNIIQRLKRKLETGPEEWETKRQRIDRMEAEKARRNGELEEPGAEEGTEEDTWPEELDMQTQEEEIEILRMEQEEETLIEAQGVWATPQEGDGNMPLTTGKEAGMHEQEEDRWREEEETRLRQEEGVTIVRGPPQGAGEPLDAQQHAELRETRGTGPPETRDINMETQQEEEEELAAMAQQQEEAQEELVTMHEMVQQQAVAQREARLAGEWRRASMGKIKVAVQETPEKYMQHLKGDTAMHKLSNEYWKKGNEMDGRNHPAPEHGKDTIPHFVDIVMLEGTEKGNKQPGYTHQRAMADAGHIHLIEVTYTDEMSWEEALKTKYTKYAPLVKLLELYGYKVTLHVMVFGNTGTIYEHTEKILTKHLGFDKQEALHLLRKIHDLATGYAVSLNRLYRKKVDTEPD